MLSIKRYKTFERAQAHFVHSVLPEHLIVCSPVRLFAAPHVIRYPLAIKKRRQSCIVTLPSLLLLRDVLASTIRVETVQHNMTRRQAVYTLLHTISKPPTATPLCSGLELAEFPNPGIPEQE